MRLVSVFIVYVVLSLSVAVAASDSAKNDTLVLHESVVNGLMTYIELGENSGGRSKELGAAMKEKVSVPVAKAQAEWRKVASEEDVLQEYQIFQRCDVAASSLLKISDTISTYVTSDSTDEPDYDPLLVKFSSDLTECEKALDVQLTF